MKFNFFIIKLNYSKTKCSDLFFISIRRIKKGLRIFRKPFMPFIRYISLDGITFTSLFNHLFLQNEFSKSRLCERPYGFKGTSNSLLFCLFVSPFSVPFFKLLLFFLRFKELLNSGQQRSRKRVDLIVRYPRIVFFFWTFSR